MEFKFINFHDIGNYTVLISFKSYMYIIMVDIDE